MNVLTYFYCYRTALGNEAQHIHFTCTMPENRGSSCLRVPQGTMLKKESLPTSTQQGAKAATLSQACSVACTEQVCCTSCAPSAVFWLQMCPLWLFLQVTLWNCQKKNSSGQLQLQYFGHLKRVISVFLNPWASIREKIYKSSFPLTFSGTT